jgi:hypothetical protein
MNNKNVPQIAVLFHLHRHDTNKDRENGTDERKKGKRVINKGQEKIKQYVFAYDESTSNLSTSRRWTFQDLSE